MSDDADNFWWKAGEPIWVTAEKQGIISGTVMWPGSEVNNRPDGARQTYSVPYRTMSLDSKVDKLFSWYIMGKD